MDCLLAPNCSRPYVGLSRCGGRPTDRTRERLSRQRDRVTPAVTGAAVAPGILPLMLGVHGKRRCFFASRNIAETCGTGVVPAAFALLWADRGHLAFPHFGDEPRWPPPRQTRVPEAGFAARHGSDAPTRAPANSCAARIQATAGREHTGELVDGTVAVAPGMLPQLLRITDLARTPDGSFSGHRPVTVPLTKPNPGSGPALDVTMRWGSPPPGAGLTRATLGGRPGPPAFGAETGHPVYTPGWEPPALSSRTLVLHLPEPHTDQAPTLPCQLLVTPLRAKKQGGTCRA